MHIYKQTSVIYVKHHWSIALCHTYFYHIRITNFLNQNFWRMNSTWIGRKMGQQKSVATSAALRSTIGRIFRSGRQQEEISCLMGKMGYRKQKRIHFKDKIYLMHCRKSRKRLEIPTSIIVLCPIWREELRCSADLLEKTYI